jgi:hypothetical protein
MASAVAFDNSRAAAYRADVENLLESRVAASILIASVAANCRRAGFEPLGPAYKLSATDRAELPVALARVIALAKQARLKLDLPWNWLDETAKQFKKSHRSLDADQLCALGEAGLLARNFELAYAASAAGLERGGSSDAEFLLLRAKALPDHQFVRRSVCAATAAELGRRDRNPALVDDAVGFLHDVLATDGPPITLEEAAEVLQKEKAEPAVLKSGKRGPDYSGFAPSGLCPCPKCRRARGEFAGADLDADLDDDDDLFEDLNDFELPPDMPPAIARMLLEETEKAVKQGESLEELFARLIGAGMPAPGGKKKGKRK